MVLAIDSRESLDKYVKEINAFPVLKRGEEAELARRYRSEADEEASEKLVVSNLRFVVKIAHEYKGYKLKLLDLIQEGNIGLMIAVQKFDPEKGYRLISYAVWWIRAYIQNFVLKSWSLVKIGTTQAQRKLFFKLRSERSKLERELKGEEAPSASELARRLGVLERDVNEMELRMGGRDFSLDGKPDSESRQTHLDVLPDLVQRTQEDDAADNEEKRILLRCVNQTMGTLNEKERFIVHERLMSDEPQTLQQIGNHFSISRERARQIEGNVLRKFRLAMDGTGLGPVQAAA